MWNVSFLGFHHVKRKNHNKKTGNSDASLKRRIKTDAIRIELTITFQVKLRLTNRNTFGREIILFEQLISHAVLTTSRFDHALEVI